MFPGIYEQAYKTPKAGWNLKSNAPVADDDVVTKSAMSSVEELRKMSICVPLYWRSTTLPPNSMWANGDLVLFENWPDVTEIYTNGGFSGMLLPYNADSATIAANIGMWRPNAASPTGLFAPNLGDQFFRNWVSGLSRQAGSFQNSATKNAIGTLHGLRSHGGLTTLEVPGSVLFWQSGNFYEFASGSMNGAPGFVHFDLSRGTETANETRPANIAVPVILYLGRAA